VVVPLLRRNQPQQQPLVISFLAELTKYAQLIVSMAEHAMLL